MLRKLMRVLLSGSANRPRAHAQSQASAGRRTHFDDRRRRPSDLARDVLATSPVIFDTETTGLSGSDQIVEISCVSATGEVLLDSLVRASCPVSQGARQVHRISDADLAQAPTIQELMPALHEVFDGRTVLAYNFDFDRRLLAQTISAAGLHWPDEWRHWGESPDRYCIMRLYARFRGDKWHKLGDALAQCGLELDDSLHRASADASAALLVLQHIASGRR
ncbi:MAG: 3'-5' exonuclease [Chloroflexi bacterium]|nr:3'-5' exonuclease [Chloroflexota bacterium]